MNEICALFTLCVFIMIYCLGSCAPFISPVEKKQLVESEIEKPVFLSDRHQKFDMVCSSCHQETPPSKLVSTDVCIGCHAAYSPSDRPPLTDYSDPHNSHATFSDCSECHNAHKPSRDFCSTCHGDLGFNIP